MAAVRIGIVFYLLFWAQSLAKRLCEYGTEPGYWDLNKKPGSRYELANDSCAYQNYLAQETFEKSHLRILFLSDSLDTFILKSVCLHQINLNFRWNLTVRENLDQKRHQSLNYCEIGNLQLGMYYVPGVNPIGPYHMYVQGNAIERTNFAKEQFWEIFHTIPDTIIIASCYWDMIALNMQQKHFTKQIVFDYAKNLNNWIRHIRSAFNSTNLRIIYHTHPESVHPQYSNFSYLNMAGRSVARQQMLEVVDYEQISRIFRPAELMREDGVHPNDWFCMEIFNLYLNMLL